MVSKEHLTKLNELIRTQHKLLKLKMPLSGDPEAAESLEQLFNNWTKINFKLNKLYESLQSGTICLEEK